MKSISIILTALFITLNLFSQNPVVYPAKGTDLANLEAVARLSDMTTAIGFDTRYQGVKGTTKLFDTLIASSLLIRGEENFIPIESDIDVVRNALVYFQASSGEMREIISDHISEVIVHKDGKDLIYKTTRGVSFDKEIPENKFYQVLKAEPYQFINVPEKEFVKADYKRAYSPDIRYDEFKPINKYYIKGSGNVFYRVQLNKKSLTKVFPDKKDVIEKGFKENTGADTEMTVISILEQF